MPTQTIHPIQAEILVMLGKNSETRFAQLNQHKITSDWFSYHLKKVVASGYVKKDKNKYFLTKEGKRLALQIDQEAMALFQSQRISVLVVVKQNEKLLIQQRHIEPFKDYWEFPTAKIPFGESPEKTAQKLLLNETGLTGDLRFLGINHKIELNGGALFDDKYYFVFEIIKPKGILFNSFEEGMNHWLSISEFLSKKKRHFDSSDTLSLISGKQILTDITGEITDY